MKRKTFAWLAELVIIVLAILTREVFFMWGAVIWLPVYYTFIY